jgi:tetratricopeptide (TPR) repeat protein
MPKNAEDPKEQILRHWESVERLAAESRLRIARRYEEHFDRLDKEFLNLRASQSWLATEHSEEAARFLIAYVEVLAPYLRQRGLDTLLLQWCEDGLQACKILQRNRGWLLLLMSEAQNALGQWEESAASIQAAMEASEVEDPPTYARAVLSFGRLQLNQGDYETALETLAEAERLLSEQSNYEGVATARSEVAAYYLNRRELDKALSLYQKVEQLRREAGATEASNHTLLMLGVVYRKKEEYEKAITYLQRLLERGKSQSNPGAMATAAHHLAWVRLNQGNVSGARRQCGRAMALYEDIGDLRGTSDAYEQLGLIMLAEGRTNESLSYLEHSLEMRRELGNQHGVASSLRHLAVVHLRMGHLLLAVRKFWQGLSTYRRLGVLSRQRLSAILQEIFDWIVRGRWWTV